MGVVFEYLSPLSTAPPGVNMSLTKPPVQAAADRQNATLVFRRHQTSEPNTHWTELHKQTCTKKLFTYTDQETCLNYHSQGKIFTVGLVKKLFFYHDCVEATACYSHCMLHIHCADCTFIMHRRYCSETKLIIRRRAITLTHH